MASPEAQLGGGVGGCSRGLIQEEPGGNSGELGGTISGKWRSDSGEAAVACRHSQGEENKMGRKRRREIEQLQKKLGDLIYEGIIDEQFIQVKELHEDDPELLSKFTSTYFGDSEKILENLSKLSDDATIDFAQVEEYLMKLKGSSLSIGFQGVSNACEALIGEYNKERFGKLLQKLKEENSLVKGKLKTLLHLNN